MENSLVTVGWREWVGLTDLGIPQIKAKIDTGARTSCLHAFNLRAFQRAGEQWLEFKMHPKQRDLTTVVVCTAPAIDQRAVTDSGGHTEERWVIKTNITIGPHTWPIEATLTSRDNMRFRMLIGRNALKHRALVDSSRSYLVGKKKRRNKQIDESE